MGRYVLVVLWFLFAIYAIMLYGMVKDCLLLKKDEREVEKNKDLADDEKNRVLQSIHSQRASFFITLAIFSVVLAGLISATIIFFIR